MSSSNITITDRLYYNRLFFPCKNASRTGLLLFPFFSLCALTTILFFRLKAFDDRIAVSIVAILSTLFCLYLDWSSSAARIKHFTEVSIDGATLRINRGNIYGKQWSLKRVLFQPIGNDNDNQSINVEVQLSDCRYYEGYSFHDGLLRHFSARPALVLSWFPYTDKERVVCAFTKKKRDAWIELLETTSAKKEPNRTIHEREIILGFTIVSTLIALIIFLVLVEMCSMMLGWNKWPFEISLFPSFHIMITAGITGNLIGKVYCHERLSKAFIHEYYKRIEGGGLYVVGLLLFANFGVAQGELWLEGAIISTLIFALGMFMLNRIYHWSLSREKLWADNQKNAP